MFGLMTELSRVVNKPRGSGYSVRIWLENDGDIATQADAALRHGVDVDEHSAIAYLTDDWRIYLYLGKDKDVAVANCVDKTILVTSKLSGIDGNCMAIDKNYLHRSGAVSINIENGNPIFEHSRDAAKARPWGY